ARGQALREADLVVLAGVLLACRLTFGRRPVFADDARRIYVDVDDHRKHGPAQVAIYGNVKSALAELASAVEGAPARRSWLDGLREAETGARRRDESMTRSDSSPVHPARLISEVDRFADPDAVIVGDGGDFVSFAGRLLERRKPGLWIDPGPFGCCASGAGSARAGKSARPATQV